MSEMRDSADATADKDIATRASRADRDKRVQNEIDSTNALPGGRNNPIHTTVPGMDAPNAHDRAMAQHSADFISAQVRGNRAGMESARQGFHTVRQAAGRTPKNIETPCEGAGCVSTSRAGTTRCGKADCGVSLAKDVKRPRG